MRTERVLLGLHNIYISINNFRMLQLGCNSMATIHPSRVDLFRGANTSDRSRNHSTSPKRRRTRRDREYESRHDETERHVHYSRERQVRDDGTERGRNGYRRASPQYESYGHPPPNEPLVPWRTQDNSYSGRRDHPRYGAAADIMERYIPSLFIYKGPMLSLQSTPAARKAGSKCLATITQRT